ncbi:unnamed protein product [Cylindrotheca closterium]|uniref:HSF-type DNA-binding domain-containing protein n=1 Tax=Cylindrotheca closterium TaxID=2856 RepID=A0AAD2G7Z4_9STRA|nr:unnamed protein product [Cylindrotheca closterium]
MSDEREGMQSPDPRGSGSNIIHLLRTKNQQDQASDLSGPSNPGTNTSLESLISSLRNQQAMAQAAAAASANSLNHPSRVPNASLLLQHPPPFLPSRLPSLQTSLTQHQRDLLLLSSLQQNNNAGMFGLHNNNFGLLGHASNLGPFGMHSSLSPLSSIDAALMPSLNTTQNQRIQGMNPSLLMASLQMNSGKVDPAKKSESFPEKLHRLLLEVELEGLSDIISFTSDGRAFQIHKPKQFFDKIVPRYFNQSHLSSFKRQLNLYGFEALSNGALKGAYFHQDFQKTRPELCKLIHRRNQKWRAPESKS